jgi:hypothetical protein
MKDIELRDGETYTTRITFPGARLLVHECYHGPVCLRSAAYCASEGEVESCDHWTCLGIISAPCELCFVETMEETADDGSDEPPQWWIDMENQSWEIMRLWRESNVS